MNIDELVFFDNRPNQFKIYETILDRLSRFGYEYSIRVQKTQISLYNQYMFVCVSFARVKKKTELPPHYLAVTFGLNYAKDSGRIAVCTEAARNRWTHHVVIGSVSDVDEELLGWFQETYEFSNRKQHRLYPHRGKTRFSRDATLLATLSRQIPICWISSGNINKRIFYQL